jgi:hypothetical protein
VVPAERRWYRDLVITQVLVDTLESLDMKLPKAEVEPEGIEIV